MAVALKELADVTECVVCTELFTDPRVLPCIHTYCLDCIRGFSKDKFPGDEVACPLCRKEFIIPWNGLDGLPRNFFMDKMFRVRKLTSVVAQMEKDVSAVANGMDKCQQTMKQLATEKKDFLEQVSKREREIREKTARLKQMIDRHEESLLADLKSIKQKRTSDIEAAYDAVECQLAARQSYVSYVHEIIENGTACEIATAASSLHETADELLMSDVNERTLADLGHYVVTFESSTFVADDAKKTVGELQFGKIHCHVVERRNKR